MNKRHYEHTLPNIRGSLSNTYKQAVIQGLDGYIIAEKEGTLLICKLAEEQRIKEFSKA